LLRAGFPPRSLHAAAQLVAIAHPLWPPGRPPALPGDEQGGGLGQRLGGMRGASSAGSCRRADCFLGAAAKAWYKSHCCGV